MMKLSNKQHAFIQEYLIDLNATQAAIRAGYSKHRANSIGHENLTKPYIQEAIQKAMDERAKRTEIEQDRILKEEACIAFVDLKSLFHPDGSTLSPHELPDEVSRAVAGIEVTETIDRDGNVCRKYKYRLWDKGKSLERLEKHLGMFAPEKVEQTIVDKTPRLTVVIQRGGNEPDSSS